MKRILIIALMVVAGSVFAAKPKPQSKPTEAELAKARSVELVDGAKETVRNNLNDPESARFRGVFLSPRGFIVCGEVNAKNKMGGYVGFKRFLSVRSSAYFDDEESSFVAKSWVSECLESPPPK